jgi:hypothetical protein
MENNHLEGFDRVILSTIEKLKLKDIIFIIDRYVENQKKEYLERFNPNYRDTIDMLEASRIEPSVDFRVDSLRSMLKPIDSLKTNSAEHNQLNELEKIDPNNEIAVKLQHLMYNNGTWDNVLFSLNDNIVAEGDLESWDRLRPSLIKLCED